VTDPSKIKPAHTARAALVYIRQSSPSQVEHNRESTARQYALADRACQLGWSTDQIVVVDDDLGISGATADKRSGFTRMTTEVALGRIGLILAIEVSRLARNNADWYRLIELCGLTDTLIGDNDGIYHPALFNDRLLLGLKGTMSEAELHIIRARLDGGIRNKAARGELRRGLPVGFVWGEADGEVLLHPDEAVTGALRAVFDRFAEFGSARRVWLWFHEQQLQFPHQDPDGGIRWIAATYTAIHSVLTNPVYAGAYVYGKSRSQRYVGEDGVIRNRIRHLPMEQWAVVIRDHHRGFIDWPTFETNQSRLDTNTRPRPHEAGGALREGSALLQGIAVCGHCGRKLRTHYRGRNSTPGYHCAGKDIVSGRGVYCLNTGGIAIDRAVASAFLEAVTPGALEATLLTFEQMQSSHDAALKQRQLEIERLRYEAEQAERRYRAVEPENRLVARGLESEWENRLRDVAAAETELLRRRQQQPCTITAAEMTRIQTLGADLRLVWEAPTTTDRDRKQLLRTMLEEVTLDFRRAEETAHLTLRWHGGAITSLDVAVPRFRPVGPRTDEDTIDLLRRLAAMYPDEVIAGILNKQGRTTAMGERFTANTVGNLRRYRGIPRYEPPGEPPDGEPVSIRQAARILGLNTSTIHRWLNDGFIAGEQVTAGAPWQIRVDDKLRSRIVGEAPPEYLPMLEATIKLGVSRQTVLQRVKRGELDAVLVTHGRRKGLRIRVIQPEYGLFEPVS
jgi:DNA invertase Pin-like site-specific DNA recombinase